MDFLIIRGSNCLLPQFLIIARKNVCPIIPFQLLSERLLTHYLQTYLHQPLICWHVKDVGSKLWYPVHIIHLGLFYMAWKSRLYRKFSKLTKYRSHSWAVSTYPKRNFSIVSCKDYIIVPLTDVAKPRPCMKIFLRDSMQIIILLQEQKLFMEFFL